MISDQQKEIHDKDTQIGERERVIYSLKKRTQELEKFKFVLDYKIKDLKRDIAPREAEIGKLKEQTENMDNSLRKFNIVNSQLGFMVNDLRTKQEEMSKLIKASSAKIRKNDIYI
jgi:chromosome segregation ATPase